MKRLIIASLLISTTAIASAENTFGLDAALVVPVGDYADGVNLAGGALARLEFPAGPGAVTARAGLLLHSVKNDAASLVMVPIYAGYRFPVGPSGLYLAGELGLTYARASADTQFGTVSDSETELGLTLGGGLKRGALDFRLAVFSPDADELVGLMATVGYDFATF